MKPSLPKVVVEMYTLLIFCGCIFGAFGFNFNTKDVQQIRVKNNSYFGYTVLLQKGRQPAVIIGAPRQTRNSGGTLHYCNLSSGRCSDYTIPESARNPPYSFSGNWLGSSLDGSEETDGQLVVCAPKVVSSSGENHFLNGYCFLKRNSSQYGGVPREILNNFQKESQISQFPGSSKPPTYFYDYAFGESGFDVHYLQKEKKVVLGAPGVKNWNGALVVQSLTDLNDYDVIPEKTAPHINEMASYLGYKVTSARLEATRNRVWYLAGSPRGSNLLGNVKIYNTVGTLSKTLTGYEVGAYFGSCILAIDLNNDHIDDLLVGAPMGAGTSWDEGYVYFYKNYRSKFENPVQLVGSKKAGARFGTAAVSLGDIDLDSFNDVAISAPYENDGVGAVYIYRGSRSGINPIYSQRLSPLEFSPAAGGVRGFGQGLSRGVDIDGNYHNDLAVGAYQSDQVFIIKAISIIDYQLLLEANESSISGGAMNVQYCAQYTQRSKANDLKNIEFKIELDFDYRTEGTTHIEDILNVTLSQNLCKSLVVTAKQFPVDISPFKIVLKSEIQRSDLLAIGENKLEKSIPYSHGCGDDNICQTNILITAFTTLQNIVLGRDKEIAVGVTAENVGEPGYSCQLNLNFPNVIELRDKDCNLENGTYVCPFTARLITTKETNFKFDIKLKNPDLDKITIGFEVKCLGENVTPGVNVHNITLDVLVENAPNIQGSSVPDNFYFNEENMQDIEATHIFKIGNMGPSPVKLDVFLMLPSIKVEETDVFMVEAKGSLNGIQEVQCHPTNNPIVPVNDTAEEENVYDVQSMLSESLNRTIVIDCFKDGTACLQLYCDGEYLYKSTEIAEYKVKITVKTTLLASAYHNELSSKDVLTYISTAFLNSSSGQRIEGHAVTQIFASNRKPVPLWIYIVASIVGVLLLALLIFLLYKCHFFDRNYRDKLKGEKLTEQNMEDDSDISEVNLNQET